MYRPATFYEYESSSLFPPRFYQVRNCPNMKITKNLSKHLKGVLQGMEKIVLKTKSFYGKTLSLDTKKLQHSQVICFKNHHCNVQKLKKFAQNLSFFSNFAP